MKINDQYYERNKQFVVELGKLLNMAKPHLVSCEYKLGEEFPVRNRYQEQLVKGEFVITPIPYQPEGEFVIVTCKNGYKYEVNVTACSLAAIAEEVFRAMVSK